MSQPRLYPVACESKDFALTGYADTIICEPGIGNNDSTLIGIRLGGEPAATQALATVLRTGVPFRITVDGNEFTCQGDKHKYSLQYGAAVPYCEALLTIQDEEIEGKEKVRDRESSVSFIKSRVHFLYCAVGDHTSLFRQIQRKTCAPMLPEFQDYVLCEAQRDTQLRAEEGRYPDSRHIGWRPECLQTHRHNTAIPKHIRHTNRRKDQIALYPSVRPCSREPQQRNPAGRYLHLVAHWIPSV